MSTIAPQTLTLPDGRSVIIRHTLPEDAAACLYYLRGVLPESPHFLLTPDEMTFTVDDEAKWLRSNLENPASIVLSAWHGEEVISLLDFRPGDRKRTRHCGSFGVGVRAAWRGLGVGTAMLHTLIDWARANPIIENITLGAFANNTRAIALYERLGFREYGRQPHCFKLENGEYVDDVTMWLAVK